MSHNAEYIVTQIVEKLVGMTIVGAVVGDGGFPAFLCQDEQGRERWVDVQSDAEGNDAGWLHVDELGDTTQQVLVAHMKQERARRVVLNTREMSPPVGGTSDASIATVTNGPEGP